MCMVDYCDEWDKVNTRVTRRARKTHKCEECRREIQPGELYEHRSGIDSESRPWVYKLCAHCEVAVKWLIENCGGWVRPMVREEIAEHVDEYRGHVSLMRMKIAMDHRWTHRRGPRAGRLMPIPALPKSLKDHLAEPVRPLWTDRRDGAVT